MGTISNLTTNGNYRNSINGYDVAFDFVVDNNESALRRINNGQISKDGQYLGDFRMDEYGSADKVFYNLAKGMGVELVTAIDATINQFEAKLTDGSAALV